MLLDCACVMFFGFHNVDVDCRSAHNGYGRLIFLGTESNGRTVLSGCVRLESKK